MTLIDRLFKLDGPITEGREVDALIKLSPWYADTPSYDPIWRDFIRALGGSVDAAIALSERVLPDHQTGYLPRFFKDSAYAGIVSEKGKAVDLLKSTIEGGSTPAIALCIALLRAKEASHGE